MWEYVVLVNEVPSEFQKKLNQWRHTYQITVTGVTFTEEGISALVARKLIEKKD